MDLFFRDITCEPKETIELVRSWRNRPDVRRWMLTDHVISSEEHAAWIKSLSGRADRKAWVVYLKDTPVGFAQFSKIDQKEKSVEWGVYVGDDNLRGIGLGRKMLGMLLSKAFDEMGCEEMHTSVLADNTKALSIYRKMGFSEIRGKRRKIERDDGPVDVLSVSLRRKDYMGMKR